MQRSSYRSVLATSGIRWLLATSLVARLPIAMVSLAIILRVSRATGSYAHAGLATAAYVIGAGVSAPFVGRVADRVGRRSVLVVAATLNGAGLVGLAFIPPASTAPLLIVALVAGASSPPVAAVVRSLWSVLGEGDGIGRLFALDASLQEIVFIIGPAIVALTTAVADPRVALVLCGSIALLGTLSMSLHPAVAGRVEAADGSLGAAAAAMVTLVAVMAVLFVATGSIEVTLVAFASRHGASDQSGLLFSVWAAGAMFGGLFVGAHFSLSDVRLLVGLLLATAAGLGLLCLAPGMGLMYPLVAVAGVAMTPAFACIYHLVGERAPAHAAVEAFGWLSSGIQGGLAAGAALGGTLVQDFGTRTSFLCAAGTAGLAAGLGMLVRRPR